MADSRRSAGLRGTCASTVRTPSGRCRKAKFVAEYQDRPVPSYDSCTFGIETVDEGRLIGLVGLGDTQHDIGTSELTVYIGETDGRGRGFGTEAVRLMCRYGFDRMGLRRIQLWVADGNAAAIACYLKAGFVEEGRARRTFRSGGVWHDMVLMGLLEDELR